MLKVYITKCILNLKFEYKFMYEHTKSVCTYVRRYKNSNTCTYICSIYVGTKISGMSYWSWWTADNVYI